MYKILSISDQLQKLLDEAKKEAEKIDAEAQKKAQEMISHTKTEVETKLAHARRLSKQFQEEKIKIESFQILEEYRKKAASLRDISKDHLIIAENFILKKVLPQ